MPNKYIYVLQNSEYDYSRWLNLAVRPSGEATVYLSDLCHPGRISGLKSVNLPISLLIDGLRNGAVQVVVSAGYFVARREDDLIQIEFRSTDDLAPSKVEVRADEVMRRLEELTQSVSSATTA